MKHLRKKCGLTTQTFRFSSVTKLFKTGSSQRLRFRRSLRYLMLILSKFEIVTLAMRQINHLFAKTRFFYFLFEVLQRRFENVIIVIVYGYRYMRMDDPHHFYALLIIHRNHDA